MTAHAALLSDGRLHLQHGPIDCLCRAWGSTAEVEAAYWQAAQAFPAVLPGLVAELPVLRTPLGEAQPELHGAVAQAMAAACAPFAAGFITPMAAVAGAVADHLLRAMLNGRRLDRAFVNNGGDIAVHAAPGHPVAVGLVAAGAMPGQVTLQSAGGVATSGAACKGRGGRSFSFGIADAVTVLAHTAAAADAAASVIGNAVDLPGHRAIIRRPACDIDPDSDLGARLVTWQVGMLTEAEAVAALDAGRVVADALLRRGIITGAALMLRGRVLTVGCAAEQLEAV